MATEPKARIVAVTPDQAAEWLQCNTHNRPVSQLTLKTLVRAIDNGTFRLSNDAIAFDWDGVMLNGQHRCHAIIETGKTLLMLVVEGLDPKSQYAMGIGKKRAVYEQFGFLGIKGGSGKAALCRALLNYDSKNGWSTSGGVTATYEEIISLAEGDELIDVALSMSNALDGYIKGARTTAIALGYYLILEAWPEKAVEFHERLSYGTELSAGDPILKLRNLLTSGQAKQASAADRRRMLALFLKSFNNWIEGDKKVELLGYRYNEAWPAPYSAVSYKRRLQNIARGTKGSATRKARAAT